MVYVGIDVAKDKHDCFIISSEGEVPADVFTVPNSMEGFCCLLEIGRLVSGRPEKGAAVAAAEYLCGAHPDAPGFSPRNLRRMREFYRAYESAPEVLAQSMTISWM